MSPWKTISTIVGWLSAWGVIANVSEGDWTKQTEEWQEAAKRWRDEVWHPALSRSWGGSDG